MNLTRTIKIQFVVFVVVAVISLAFTAVSYLKLPALLFGVGRYTVTVKLPSSGNLYASANVTYRGTEVGKVTAVQLTGTGVQAVLSMNSDVPIPSDLDAQVHSQTAIGEQYVELSPRNGTAAPLKDGDVIPVSRTSVPPDINSLLNATNRGLQAIPHDNVKTLVDESYNALGGLSPELSRFIDGATTLAIDARHNLDALTNLIDHASPLLDSQSRASDSVQAWAAHLATITNELKTQDPAVASLLRKGPATIDEVRALFDRLHQTLPIVLANLATVGDVAVVYRADIEQLLVLIPQGVANVQGSVVANLNTKQDYAAGFLSFNTGNLGVPPTCMTGFLPAQQRRPASLVDAPDRPAGDLYCRVPQDSMWNVRGVRNIPCETVPGKRAPTVAMCESPAQYVPLNDGFSWKGDPNATVTGQDIPQVSPGAPIAAPAPAAPPRVPALATAQYDPATGTYIGPDGQVFTQSNLAQTGKEQTWQTMLMPPTGH